MSLPVQLITTLRGDKIAYCVQRLPKADITVLYCPGLLSSMQGRKGEFLQEAAQSLGCNYAALEYRGQGRSEGHFIDCTLQDWIDDVVHVVDHATPGAAHILVGSSIGAWLALHAVLARPHAVRICSVRDGEEGSKERKGCAASQLVSIPSNYIEGGGVTLRRSFIADANQQHLLLSGAGRARLAALRCAIHVMYTQQDDAVPPQIPMRLAEALRESGCAPVELENIPDGDHRLSRETDLQRMGHALSMQHRSISGSGSHR